MSTTYFTGATAKTHYIKELPLNTGAWAAGVTTATQNGSTGSFSVTTDDAKEYLIYEQQGGSPASSDVFVGQIGVAINTPTAAAIADAVFDEAMSGHTVAGSFGASVIQVGVNHTWTNTATGVGFDRVTVTKTP